MRINERIIKIANQSIVLSLLLVVWKILALIDDALGGAELLSGLGRFIMGSTSIDVIILIVALLVLFQSFYLPLVFRLLGRLGVRVALPQTMESKLANVEAVVESKLGKIEAVVEAKLGKVEAAVESNLSELSKLQNRMTNVEGYNDSLKNRNAEAKLDGLEDWFKANPPSNEPII